MVTVNANAVYVQIGGKIARIPHVDLQEDNRLIRRDVIILALLLLPASILSVIAPARLGSDNAEVASRAPSRGIFSTRNSVVRQTRETRELTTIAMMKKAPIFRPSGRSMTLTKV